MFITNHALAGAAIGLVLRRPVVAFAAGVASHVAMDLCLHWGDEDLDWDGFVEVARVDGTLGLAASAAALAAAPRRARPAVAAAIAGACLIDMDKPGRHFVGRSPFPAVVDRVHRRIQNEHPIGGLVEASAVAGLAATVGALAFRARRAATGRDGPRLATVTAGGSSEVTTWRRSTHAAPSRSVTTATRSTG